MHQIPSCFPGLSQGQPERDQKTPPLRTPVARARGRHMDVPHQQMPPAPLCTPVWWPHLRQSSYTWSDDHASASPYIDESSAVMTATTLNLNYADISEASNHGLTGIIIQDDKSARCFLRIMKQKPAWTCLQQTFLISKMWSTATELVLA